MHQQNARSGPGKCSENLWLEIACDDGSRHGPEAKESLALAVREQLVEMRDAIDSGLEIWPDCTVTAADILRLPEVDAIRPGTYVFGDLMQNRQLGTIEWDQIAATVLAGVVDKPEPGLALARWWNPSDQ